MNEVLPYGNGACRENKCVKKYIYTNTTHSHKSFHTHTDHTQHTHTHTTTIFTQSLPRKGQTKKSVDEDRKVASEI